MNSERQIMDVPVDRGICCHVGGDIVFDSAGNLILSTGDDTNPFESDGYTPIDERPDRNPAFDAQRTSANTNDLRGKILRITPNAKKGGYTIPDGNLFEEGTEGTRPEIYAMGFRNPFRIEINAENDEIYVGDYSPDNPEADPQRGPAGQGKWTIIREPGNYGWPYCATAELPYVDYDFATEESGEEFDCANPVNESPHNTGLTELPPVVQPDVWYSFGPSAEFPELGTGGIGPMAGPAYVFDPDRADPPAWPQYYDGVPLFYEWTRDYIKEFRLNDAGEVAEINPVLDGVGPANGDEATLDNGMDMEFGPDGALYTLEYGDGFFSENPDAQLARIDYIGPDGNHAPQVEVAADPDSAFEPPLTVQFSSEGTTDPDGDEISYEWRLQGKKKVDSTDPNPEFTYKKEGVYLATLKVTDEHGRSASSRRAHRRRQPGTDRRVRRAAGRPGVRLGRRGRLRGRRHRRGGDRLLAGVGPPPRRPRPARPSGVDDQRLHRDDPDVVASGPRTRRDQRRVRRRLHRPGRPERQRPGRARPRRVRLSLRRTAGAERPGRLALHAS